MVEDDIKDFLKELSEYTKSIDAVKHKKEELEKVLSLVTNELKESRASEKRFRSILDRKQSQMEQLAASLHNFLDVKEENGHLQTLIVNLKEELQADKSEFRTEQEKWDKEKSSILIKNEEEIRNILASHETEVKTITEHMKQMENTSIQRIQELERQFVDEKNNFNWKLEQSANTFEDQIIKLNRDLVAAENEVKNLRQVTNSGIGSFNIQDYGKRRTGFIPQPLALPVQPLPRYNPLPIITEPSSQSCGPKEITKHPNSTNEDIQHFEDSPFSVKLIRQSLQMGKKRKLYSRSDDTLC